MAQPNVPLNIPQRKTKGVITLFGVEVVPFYKLDEVAPEGAPVKLSATADTVELVTAGAGDTVFGLTAQEVYDDVALGQLRGYSFHNDTRAAKGDTIGIIVGNGYIYTSNYVGAVAYGDNLYPAASGKLSTTSVSGDAAVGVAEGSGTDGDMMIRVRVNFGVM